MERLLAVLHDRDRSVQGRRAERARLHRTVADYELELAEIRKLRQRIALALGHQTPDA